MSTWSRCRVHALGTCLVALVAAAATGCAKEAEGGEVDSAIRGPSPVVPAAECAAVEANAWEASRFAGDGDVATLVSPATPAPFVGATLELSVLGDATAGTFDLADERDFGTCVHCLTAYGGPEEGRVFFFQTEGALVLDAVDLETGVATGALAAVKLVEGSLSGSPLAFVPKPGGRCLTLATSVVRADPHGG